MTKEELILMKEESANKLLVKSFLALDVMIILVWIINMLGIFILDKVKFSILAVIIILISMIPVFITNVLKINGHKLKYIYMGISVLIIGLAYIYVTFHATIMFMIPMLAATLYYNRKVNIFTQTFSCFIMVVSHFVAPLTQFVNAGYMEKYNSELITGVISKLGIFIFACVLISMFSEALRKKLDKELNYYMEIHRSKMGLEKVIELTSFELKMDTFDNILTNVINASFEILDFVLNKKCDCSALLCVRNVDEYKFVNRDMVETQSDCRIVFNTLVIDNNEEEIIIPLNQRVHNGKIEFYNDFFLMTVYKDGDLCCMLKINYPIKEDEEIIKEVFEVFYEIIKIDIINTLIYEEMNLSQEMLIKSFSEISEFKSGKGGKHIRRMSEYMKIMGKSLCKDDEDEYRALCIAVMLHDVGNLVIPENILDKPDKLTEDEFSEVKKHTSFGGELLNNAPGKMMSMAKQIAENHHERWDGKGYKGLSKDEIDKYSQYVAIIDVFDALVSDKPYRKAWSPKDAYDEIIKNKGTQFSPKAVEAFAECFDEIMIVYNKYKDAE